MGTKYTCMYPYLTGDYGEVSCGYKSSSDFLTLQLHTDETISSTGFRATYRSVDKTTATVLVTGINILISVV